jgi:hypothetical protein
MTSPTNIIVVILFVLAIAALVLYSRKCVGAKYESEYKSKYESGQKEKYAQYRSQHDSQYRSQYDPARESAIPAYSPRPSNDANDVVIQFSAQPQQQVVHSNFNSDHSSSSSCSSSSGDDDKQVRFGIEQVRVFSKDNPEFLVDYEATRVKSKDASLDLKDPRYQERLRSQVQAQPPPSLPLLQPLILQPQTPAASSVSSMSW